MFESAGPFAESTEAFPLGTRMTLGKRKIRRKSRDAWCSTLKSLRAYGTIDTDKPRTPEKSRVRGFLVTNVILFNAL